MTTASNVEIKKATLSTDKTLLDQNNLEIPPNCMQAGQKTIIIVI